MKKPLRSVGSKRFLRPLRRTCELAVTMAGNTASFRVSGGARILDRGKGNAITISGGFGYRH
jgi:hypothetical protein